MNILICEFSKKRGEAGSAVAVVLALLALMMVCVAANTVAVRSLGRELKLLEKHQVHRLQFKPGEAAARQKHD